MPGNPLVRFDEGRVGRTACVALSPTLLAKLVLPALQPKGRNYGRKPKGPPRPAIFHFI